MSQFNPDLFMQTEVADANSTRRVPVPEGEYAGVIKSINPRVVGERGAPVLDIEFSIDDETVKERTGLVEPTVRYSIWLDVTESGGLDCSEGKNIGLGRLREALGQNQRGKPWAPTMLIGQVAKIKVTHSPDKNDPETVYANVVAVSKL